VFLPAVKNKEHLSGHSKFYEIENLNGPIGFVREKGADISCPLDGRNGAAYIHTLEGGDHVGEANHMLSWAWEYTVQDVVDTLVHYCSMNSLDPKCTYIWMCCLCINQHRVAEQNAGKKTGILNQSTLEFQEIFVDRVQSIGKVLCMMSPWDAPSYLKRVWCIFEIFTAMQNECELVVVMPPYERE
jgi:hypothetical protein